MPYPPKLTDERTQKLMLVLRTGAYIETACAFVGIEKETFHRWMRQGEKGGKRFAAHAAFRAEIMRVMAEAEVSALARIAKAGETIWQADAWRLERRYPERYGRQRIEHTGVDGGPIQVAGPSIFVPPEDRDDGPDVSPSPSAPNDPANPANESATAG
jgi:transposase